MQDWKNVEFQMGSYKTGQISTGCKTTYKKMLNQICVHGIKQSALFVVVSVIVVGFVGLR